MDDSDTIRHRALFISDVHLGTQGCQAGMLIEFLRQHDADTIYLVGDIVDGWRLKSGWYWPQEQNDVVQKLLRKVRKGARLVYIPGNHDEFLRDFLSLNFGDIEIVGRTLCFQVFIHCRVGSLESFLLAMAGSAQIHCRVGSLERWRRVVARPHHIHCRVGSLEMCAVFLDVGPYIHCRVGSLEKRGVPRFAQAQIHCRVGSLEMPDVA